MEILEFRIRFGECRGSIKRTKCVWRICDNFVTDFVTTLIQWTSYGPPVVQQNFSYSGSKWLENQNLPESEKHYERFKILIILIFCLVAKGWTVKRYQICVEKSKPESTKNVERSPWNRSKMHRQDSSKRLFLTSLTKS